MKEKKNLIWVTIALLFSYYSVFPQLSVPFKVRYQGLVKGDMAIIANNIINRSDYNNTSNEPYYNHTNSAKLNDEFDMEYIDIDQDEDTFSSSSAELFLEKSNNKRIIYAGLYWSANYKYNVGIIEKGDKYVAQDSDRESFNTIKIKFPNQEKYVDVVGQTIFDGLKERDIKDFAPYAVYADITEYVKNLPNPSGVYTIANIRATQGKISGGVAAGWTIFFVYEDNTMSEKFIKTQDGFATISEKPTDIVFNGFEVPQQGQINAKIACIALEGDTNLFGDQLLIGNEDTNTFSVLSNSIRKENNFFNSCITIDDEYFLNRFPDSKNTLGYDSFLYTIPSNNSIISNTTKEFSLEFKTTGDKFFVFFTAFQMDTKPLSLDEIKTQFSSNQTNGQNVKYVPINNDLVVDETKTASVINRIQKNSTLNDFVEIHTLSSSSIPSGYYILANIFKTEQQAQEFIYYLKSLKITADFFINPLNNYRYVYLRKINTQKEVVDLFLSKLDGTYKERMQIVLINNDNNQVNKQELSEFKIGDQSPLKIVETRAINDLHIANIPDVEKGYYIVANVFALNENSTKFINLLKSNNLNPRILVNTLNNYRYIYLKKVDTEKEARDLIQSKFNNKYESKIWILSVNN
jgi:hypothetical protein